MSATEQTALPWLSEPEIAALTHAKRVGKQRLELAALDIPFRTRTDGTIVVLRRDLQTSANSEQDDEFRPDLSSLES